LYNSHLGSECSAENAYKWTEGNCIFASGSPFDAVTVKDENGNDKLCIPTQCNNMYIFPAVGLAGVIGKCRRISNDMFYAATKKLAASQPKEKLEEGFLFPKIADIKDVSANIAASVIEMARKEGLTKNPDIPRELEDIEIYVKSKQWQPDYHHIVFSDL
jgi:malic enzyme